MAVTPAERRGEVTFAGLLRRLRIDAGLTQEELAEAAQVSTRSVSDLERGINRTARRETARLLADALHLAGPDRTAFEAAAAGRGPAIERPAPLAAAWGAAGASTLPIDIASFVGREGELRFLLDIVSKARDSAVGACTIGGMAGIGKTAFAVHAAHRIAPSFPDGQIFLPLHGHTPGQPPVDPADALASLLLTVGVAAPQIPPGVVARSGLWRHQVAGKRLLLVLDDAAGHEQVRPLLPGAPGSLALVTSRRHLTALGDAHTINLDVLPADAAVELLIALADRPGLDASDASAIQITSLCGRLPLAIGMLARQLHHHPSWTTARLAADLTAARDRLEFMHAENLSVAAAFDLSYADLTVEQQRLFRRLSLHPGTEIDAYSAAALDSTDLPTARRRLEALYDQHLLTEPVQGRYRLHDLIREHARTRSAADRPADRRRAARRLLDYFAHTAGAAATYPVRRSPGNVPAAPGSPPACAPDLPAFADAVRWMDEERLNLQASVIDASRRGLHGHVIALAAAMHGFLCSRGYWDQLIALHQLALQAARDAGDKLAEAGALTDLSEMQDLTADYAGAAAGLARALELNRRLGSRLGEASALNELGALAQSTGDNRASAASHERALRLYRDLGHGIGQACALNELGLLQFAMADYPAAASSHERALALYRDLGGKLGEASALNRLGHVQRTIADYAAAAASHEQALALYRDLGGKLGAASALNGLAVVRRATGDYAAAEAAGDEALRLYRDLGYRVGEAHALNELAAVRRAAGDYAAAEAAGDEALRLYRDLGYRLGEARAQCGLARIQLATENYESAAACLRLALEEYQCLGLKNGEADARNAMGELDLARSRPSTARSHFEAALAIATSIACVAEQACALTGIGRCLLLAGQSEEGIATLRRALTIYEEIGCADAGHVRKIVSHSAR